jgi:lactose/L-arabinose transport system substrate-binding protein
MSVAIGWALLALVVTTVVASLSPPAQKRRVAAPLDPLLMTQPQRVQGRITVWGWNIAAKSLKSLVPKFNEHWPRVEPDVHVSGANMQTRFLLSLAAGTGAPDVMQLQAYETPRYVATGRLTDLTPVAAKYAKDFPAASWANCLHDGKVYAIPWDIGPCGIFYKPHIFAKFGVDADKIETWDDFIAVGRVIVEKSRGKTKMLPLAKSQVQIMFEMLLQQLSGQVFDANGRIAVDSPQSRRVLDLIRRMLDAGICTDVETFTHDYLAGFNADTIATYPLAVWLGGTIKDTTGEYGSTKTEWRVLRLPAFERGGLRVSNLGGSTLAIPDQCENKEAAWAFIEYALCTREGQVAQYANYDLFPAFLPALKDPFFEQGDAFYSGQKVRQLFATDVDRIPVLNRTSDWVETNIYLGQSFSAWAVEHTDTNEMLKTLAGKLHRRLGRELVEGAGR